MLRSLACLVGSVLLLAACNHAEATAEAKPVRTKSAAHAEKSDKAKAKTEAKSEASEETDGPRKFVVPFAWEASRDEPLSQARAYLKEILNDNRIYMEHGPKFFAGFAEGQKPRATVLSCADSRVHTSAFDVTPENDDYMVRNIGNQLENDLGSVVYGVEHLETPVLLILGHSGCGAVKAAMGDTSAEPEPVRRELENLKLPKAKTGQSADAAWSEAVVANVHAQVAVALSHFGSRVAEGRLTIVGAVYDFRNDLGHGSGKITIVDVNGNGDTARMQAFVDAVESDSPAVKKRPEPRSTKSASGSGARGDDNEISPALQRAITRAKQIQGSSAEHAP